MVRDPHLCQASAAMASWRERLTNRIRASGTHELGRQQWKGGRMTAYLLNLVSCPFQAVLLLISCSYLGISWYFGG